MQRQIAIGFFKFLIFFPFFRSAALRILSSEKAAPSYTGSYPCRFFDFCFRFLKGSYRFTSILILLYAASSPATFFSIISLISLSLIPRLKR